MLMGIRLRSRTNLKFDRKSERTYSNATLRELSISRIPTFSRPQKKGDDCGKPLVDWKVGIGANCRLQKGP